MKKYEPKSMIAGSRYQNYFPTLTPEIQNEVYDRMKVLLEEEKQYCDKGNYAHMSQVGGDKVSGTKNLTGGYYFVAMGEVLKRYGVAIDDIGHIMVLSYER